MIELTLAHSADPDDVYMWWPLTGVVTPDGHAGPPVLDAAPFRFRAVPGDIAEFNRLAVTRAPYDVTALSARAFADVAAIYVLARTGASMGEGYGPKVVVRRAGSRVGCEECLLRDEVTIAVPGLKTTAMLALALHLDLRGPTLPTRFVEVPFDQIIPAVASGRVDAGLVIHEAQVSFAQAGLREVLDLGARWGTSRGLPLPLGVNAIRRDLDQRHAPGTIARVASLLARSLEFARAHHDLALDACMPWAARNAAASGTPTPSRDLVERYVAMYVTPRTTDPGPEGLAAIARLLGEGAASGLCPPVAPGLLAPAD